jgi:hypothetical protein
MLGLKFTYSRRAKKPSACMEMSNAMKMRKSAKTILKKPAAMKISKKPSGNALRIQKCRSAKLEAKNQKAKENARARARRAARSNKPYNPPTARLKEIAAQAYAAEVTAMSGVKKAEGAHEAADEAKKEAANARVMAFRNSKHIASLQNVAKTVMETLIETAARAKRNEERLNTDDRKRAYLTP